MYSDSSWQQQQYSPRRSSPSSSLIPYQYRMTMCNSSGGGCSSASRPPTSSSATMNVLSTSWSLKRRRSPMASNRVDGGGEDASAVHVSNNLLQERLCVVLAHAQLFGIKNEEQRYPAPEAAEPKNEAIVLPGALNLKTEHQQNEPSPASPSRVPNLDADTANGVLPPYDLLAASTQPAVQCRKFFADLRPLDRILCRIVRPGVAVLHVELVCMLSRFRRTLLAFMKGRLVPVPFDRTKRFYNVNDYISTTVMSIAPASEELELEIDDNEAILTQQGIPAYCRDFERTTFEDSGHLQSLRDNPNLATQLGIPFGCTNSGLPALRAKHFHLAPTAQQLRAEQATKLAMAHVQRGAGLTRENKCFEAIQCFNKALNVDENCADAYVGRGAACAGCRNFPAALLDLERAIQLQPNHRNANKYRVEVLHTFAKDLERDGKLAEAREKFGQLLALCPDHQEALDAMARLGAVKKSGDADIEFLQQQRGGSAVELVELDDEDSDHAAGDDAVGHGGDRRRRSSNNGGGDDHHERRRRDSAAKPQNGCAASGGGGATAKRREAMSEEEARRNRQKLTEMEAFIAKLKRGGGGVKR